MARTGRPPKSPEERRTRQLKVWATEEEETVIKQAAKNDGAELSTWIRSVLLRRARELKREQG